jgi:hypothetical protein
MSLGSGRAAGRWALILMPGQHGQERLPHRLDQLRPEARLYNKTAFSGSTLEQDRASNRVLLEYLI